MKIEQTPKFQPITITLETAEEAATIWDAVGVAIRSHDRFGIDQERILRDLCDWFSNQAQVGGSGLVE